VVVLVCSFLFLLPVHQYICILLTFFPTGFFEQGFLINAGMILTITISATAAGTIWLVKNGRIPSWGFRV
jgi:hypothetical protein